MDIAAFKQTLCETFLHSRTKASAIVVTTAYMISYRGGRSLSFHTPCSIKTKHNEKNRTLVITSSNAEEKHGHNSFQINTL